jgi:predicted secreted protein
MDAAVTKPQPPSPKQRKRAVVTGLVLAAVAIGIYAYVVLQYLARG